MIDLSYDVNHSNVFDTNKNIWFLRELIGDYLVFSDQVK